MKHIPWKIPWNHHCSWFKQPYGKHMTFCPTSSWFCFWMNMDQSSIESSWWNPIKPHFLTNNPIKPSNSNPIKHHSTTFLLLEILPSIGVLQELQAPPRDGLLSYLILGFIWDLYLIYMGFIWDLYELYGSYMGFWWSLMGWDFVI